MLPAEVGILAVYGKYVAPPHQVIELAGCQNTLRIVADNVSMGKNKKTSVSKDR